jgi:hypothetical protein
MSPSYLTHGGAAVQMEKHCNHTAEVSGSTPLGPTNIIPQRAGVRSAKPYTSPHLTMKMHCEDRMPAGSADTIDMQLSPRFRGIIISEFGRRELSINWANSLGCKPEAIAHALQTAGNLLDSALVPGQSAVPLWLSVYNGKNVFTLFDPSQTTTSALTWTMRHACTVKSYRNQI